MGAARELELNDRAIQTGMTPAICWPINAKATGRRVGCADTHETVALGKNLTNYQFTEFAEADEHFPDMAADLGQPVLKSSDGMLDIMKTVNTSEEKLDEVIKGGQSQGQALKPNKKIRFLPPTLGL